VHHWVPKSQPGPTNARGKEVADHLHAGAALAAALLGDLQTPQLSIATGGPMVILSQGKWLRMVRAFFCLFSFISALEPGKVFLKMNFEEYSLFW
jgi:hypothetical protein